MQSPVLSEPAATRAPATPPRLPRAGGLLHVPKGYMTPVFTVFMTLLYVEVLLLVFLPFMVADRTESPWAEAPRLGFLAVSVLSSMVFGLLASVVAERRGRTAWWFLAGQAGAVVAPVLAAVGMAEDSPFWARFIVFAAGLLGTLVAFFVVGATGRDPSFPAAARPKERESRPLHPTIATLSPFTRGLSRFWHGTGNIWLGISLLVLLTVAILFGSTWENFYGAKSARYTVYASWWFGTLFVLFSTSLIAATLRKYPFRLDQTGWLATHVGLVTLIVGTFMSFWGKVEGDLELREGQSSNVFDISTRTHLRLEAFRPQGENRGRWDLVWDRIADFDLDPARKELERPYAIPVGARTTLPITVDRYYADTTMTPRATNGGQEPRAAVLLTAHMPGGDEQAISLVEGDQREAQDLGFLRLSLYRLGYPLMVEALKGGRDARGHGKLVVRNAAGEDLLSVPVEPGARPEGQREAPADLRALDVEIPGTGGVRLKGISWFSRIRIEEGTGRPLDMAPGRPAFPAAIVELDGPVGKENRTAIAYAPDLSEDSRALKTYPDLRVYLDYVPTYPLGRSELAIIVPGEGAPFWAMDIGGERRSGPVRAGEALDLGIPLRLHVDAVHDRYREEREFTFAGHNPRLQSIRVRVPDDRTEGDDDERWVIIGGGSEPFLHDGTFYRLRWEQPQHPLGFNLHLRDFHRDFYPGTTTEKTFESHLWLTHATKFPERTPIKIDMNHPLRLDGWRLYQSRFSISGADERTILQVNRDPGLAVIYPACVVLTMGLVIVFFQKPFLRALKRWLERRGAQPHAHLLAALGKVLMTFTATLPGIIIIALIPEGPAQGVAVAVIALGLFLETVFVNKSLKCRMEPSPAPVASPVGDAS